MPTWLRRTSGVLTLGGSATGVAAILDLLAGTIAPVATIVIGVAFLALFAFGIAVGVLLLESHPRAARLATAYWVLQIPFVSSGVFSYQFSTGAFVTAAVASGTFQFNAGFGAGFNFLLFSGAPLVVGVNLLAVAMTMLLWRGSAGL